MALSNDARGWIMTSISGVACVLGACVICADLLIRHVPGQKNFNIQDSDVFLSSSLSLSFGVMLFSALYSMLPSAKRSLQDGGFSPKAAAWTLIGCFLGGVIGIQVISRILHHYMPSHVVDCEHNHDEEDQKSSTRGVQAESSKPRQPSNFARHRFQNAGHGSHAHSHAHDHDRLHPCHGIPNDLQASSESIGGLTEHETFKTAPTSRPTLRSTLSKTFSKLSSTPKDACDADGPCYGFSEPCGQECFKIVQARGGRSSTSIRPVRKPLTGRSTTMSGSGLASESTPLLQPPPPMQQSHSTDQIVSQKRSLSDGPMTAVEPILAEEIEDTDQEDDESTPHEHAGDLHPVRSKASSTWSSSETRNQHHHHVPTNAFLSIGLQTSIAIALHKLPEGFITYATNHANPKLGFAVFLALFIHNITEGFAMALPLYLALQSRWKAIFWSSLLGGFSQPVGAGIAALWFKVAGSGDLAPGEGVYGCMFAITSGIMASVALQLFSESLDLTHNRNLCMGFAFIGMGILGASSALTA